jgi:uncharacterized membrane protein
MIGLALALAVGPVQLAQAAPPPASAPTPPANAAAMQRGAAAMKALGMSDAGINVLRQQSAPDPDARALAAKRVAMRGQLAAAASASPFDVDGFAALLRESSLLESTARTRTEERIVNTLKALPAADRGIYAKAVFGGGPPPPATPPRP